MRVLVVDDHRDTRRVMERLLQRYRYTVDTAGTVAEARRLAAERMYDVAICDVDLPDGNGLELMRELNSRYGTCAIGHSGHPLCQFSDQPEPWLTDYLVKPVGFHRLLDLLREIASSLPHEQS